ncbi:PREDICTED: reticulon-like protein B10 [Nelumbo nucifera]|uniref:Reticulon-like protein n=1 Tax=Nelumbo nucifera TaxID=4432 RepID=A0A1U8AT14_NELNU|nr:PREDICTED: reticulon-like protein B10 [Nelumbo nucifera]XP_010271135.1 PREDICTED: reticulon-like protein B10 [Nelumbo nucifera]XP_010271144.1 PREDICTED: reticulon-like protein B10 [Nelumbo nucifera]XP_010271154.1 PREDICTED: reticulon-like protein B10 [Nelumbo nucifera]XP_010271161.1 PREDICTED: reticulon-like protein B10 [Nelumbo nucifera]
MGENDLDRSTSEQDSFAVSHPVSRKSVHQLLGGGAVADVLLWKRWSIASFILVSTTAVWFIFERAGYSPLTLIANVLLLLVVILFFWAKSASMLNRPLPPLPNLEVSEEFVGKAAVVSRVWINRVLAVAHDIALGRDVKLFLQVASSLWLVSCFGSLLNFLTFAYIGVILSLTVPVLYDKYRDQVDEKLIITHKILLAQYRKLDDSILSKVSRPNKEKKIQ